MGFELYLQCFASGRPAGIPRSAVRALFPVVENESEPNNWRVRYDSTDMCTVGVTSAEGDPTRLHSISIYRPCGDICLFVAILSVLRMGSVILYFPGVPTPLVASESVVVDLPKELVDSMGRPRCVQSAQEIVDIMRRA
jgi:hypothetical protein